MKKYKYRSKVHGKWLDEPVEADRILEFVTRGTLTPYDFVLKEGETDSEMILDEFPEAEDKWAKLRKIRVKLNKLWEAQLDEIMAIISSGLHEKISSRQSEHSLEKFRNHFRSHFIQDELKGLWSDGVSSQFIKNEINYRKLAGDPKESINLTPNAEEKKYLNFSDLDHKYQDLKQSLKSRRVLKDRGVYVFWSGDEVTYVGKARKNFGRRFKEHFSKQKSLCDKEQFDEKDVRFLHDATKVELYFLKMNIGSKPITEFESLMIFRHGKPDNKFQPRDNRNSGSSHNPLEVALTIIDQEVSELKSTG